PQCVAHESIGKAAHLLALAANGVTAPPSWAPVAPADVACRICRPWQQPRRFRDQARDRMKPATSLPARFFVARLLHPGCITWLGPRQLNRAAPPPISP